MDVLLAYNIQYLLDEYTHGLESIDTTIRRIIEAFCSNEGCDYPTSDITFYALEMDKKNPKDPKWKTCKRCGKTIDDYINEAKEIEEYTGDEE